MGSNYCDNGHDVEATAAYCSTCGVGISTVRDDEVLRPSLESETVLCRRPRLRRRLPIVVSVIAAIAFAVVLTVTSGADAEAEVEDGPEVDASEPVPSPASDDALVACVEAIEARLREAHGFSEMDPVTDVDIEQVTDVVFDVAGGVSGKSAHVESGQVTFTCRATWQSRNGIWDTQTLVSPVEEPVDDLSSRDTQQTVSEYFSRVVDNLVNCDRELEDCSAMLADAMQAYVTSGVPNLPNERSIATAVVELIEPTLEYMMSCVSGGEVSTGTFQGDVSVDVLRDCVEAIRADFARRCEALDIPYLIEPCLANQERMIEWAWDITMTVPLYSVPGVTRPGADAANEEMRREAEKAAAEEAARIEAERIAAEEAARTAAEEAARGTVSQQNAKRSAEQYLRLMAFSRTSLIGQLEFEGYSNSDATWAVDRIDVDWYAQAVRSARSYLDMMPFSGPGLRDQLIFEGFTAQQAAHGVAAVGL